METPDDLQTLLSRSMSLREAIGDVLSNARGLQDDADKTHASAILCNLSVEHADAVLTLFSAGMPTSAVAILRIQFECLTRAIWIYYAATPAQLQGLVAELTSDGKSAGPRPPMLADMLDQLEGLAPSSALQSLRNFQAQNRRTLNSYVHAGAHAVRRHHEGMPLPIALTQIRHSNALLLMAGMMRAILTGDPSVTKPFAQFQIQFADCLPSQD